LAGAQIIGVDQACGFDADGGVLGVIDNRGKRDLLLTFEVLVQGEQLQQRVFGFKSGEALVESGEQIAGGIALFLQQNDAVGGLESGEVFVGFSELFFQAHDFFGQAGKGGVGGLGAHFFFEIDVFFHASLDKILGVVRILPRAL
jgi:hypothetical protein